MLYKSIASVSGTHLDHNLGLVISGNYNKDLKNQYIYWVLETSLVQLLYWKYSAFISFVMMFFAAADLYA